MNRICIYIYIFLYSTIQNTGISFGQFFGFKQVDLQPFWYVGAKHWQYHTPIHMYEPKPSKYKGSAYLPIGACR